MVPSYAFLSSRRRSLLRLDIQQVPNHKRRRGPVQYLDSPVFKPDGLKITEQCQRCMFEFLSSAYGTPLLQELHVRLSADDAEAFRSEWMYRSAATYGEMLPPCFLELLRKVGAKPGDRFYDLGAGPGKLVALAWMAGLRATGVELSKARWDVSCQAVAALQHLGDSAAIPSHTSLPSTGEEMTSDPARAASLELVWGSFLDVDFTDADIIFACSVVYPNDLVKALAKIARWMRPGSRIVSYHVFPGPEFKTLGEFSTPTSWSQDTDWVVQEVVANPSDDGEMTLAGLRKPEQFDSSERCVFVEQRKDKIADAEVRS